MAPPAKYKKRPVVIDAIQYNGANADEISEFVGESYVGNRRTPVISTLEGEMSVTAGDWVIKGIKGEFYPCKPDIFEATYLNMEDAFTIDRATNSKMEHHDEHTLEKVHTVLSKVGSIYYTSEEIVSQLQNEGILFRERK